MVKMEMNDRFVVISDDFIKSSEQFSFNDILDIIDKQELRI
jgi:hypothetical protein